MQGLSFAHLLIVGIVFLILFGSRKISTLMTDLAKGIKCFKTAMSEEKEIGPIEKKDDS